jgi:hypothetical protein
MKNRIHYSKLRITSFCFILISLLIFLPFINSYSIETDDLIYSIDSNPFGKHHKYWLAEWWKSNLKISAQDHPNYVDRNNNIDNTKDPTKCFIGGDSKNKVLFLTVPFVAEKFSERTCDVPSGTAIFLPIESSQCDFGLPNIINKDDLKSCAESGNDGVTILISMDGNKLDYNVAKNRIMSDYFNITMNNKLMGDYTGTYLSLSEGYTVFIKPLEAGKHDFNFMVSVVNPLDPVLDYFQNAIYHLNVK